MNGAGRLSAPLPSPPGDAAIDQHDAVGIALQQLGVFLGEGGALRRDGRVEAVGVAADHVDLSLAEDRLAAQSTVAVIHLGLNE